MAFQLQRREPIPDGVRRVLDEVLEQAVAALTAGDDVPRAVHGARKATKRVRAVARLVRPVIGDKPYRRINAAARDAARPLASSRDAHVSAVTFDALVAAADDPEAYQDLRTRLPADDGVPGPETLAAAGRALQALRARAQRLSLADGGWAAVGPGLQAVYRRGARGLSTAAGKPTAERLHEWRTQTKYLWHATELLVPAWPAVLGPFSDELHALSDSLGDLHDLDVLAARIDGAATPPGWTQLVADRHAELRSTAFSRGLRVYAERPGAFADRMRSYVAAWLAG